MIIEFFDSWLKDIIRNIYLEYTSFMIVLWEGNYQRIRQASSRQEIRWRLFKRCDEKSCLTIMGQGVHLETIKKKKKKIFILVYTISFDRGYNCIKRKLNVAIPRNLPTRTGEWHFKPHILWSIKFLCNFKSTSNFLQLWVFFTNTILLPKLPSVDPN